MKNPIDILPIEHPKDYDPSIGNNSYFYDNVVSPLIKDSIRIMSNGIPIDLDKVKDLEATVQMVLDNVKISLADNNLLSIFQGITYKKLRSEFVDTEWGKKRDYSYYLKPYKDSVVNRTVLVNKRLMAISKETLCRDRWLIKDIRKLNLELNDSILSKLLAKSITGLEDETMVDIASDKSHIYNKSIAIKIVNTPKSKILPEFNPASAVQKAKLFKYLGINAIRTTKKGQDSWGRKELEIILAATPRDNVELSSLLKTMIDHSFSAIIRNNFIKAFKNFTIDGVLYGEIKLFGAKSFRLTSNKPNLLNMPSTGSVYAKPIKKCFIAPKGYVVLTADYSALEDRVIANLSKDVNKIAVFADGLDGHSLATCVYIRNEVIEKLGVSADTDIKVLAKLFKAKVDSGDSWFSDKRQWSKDKTFKLALTTTA